MVACNDIGDVCCTSYRETKVVFVRGYTNDYNVTSAPGLKGIIGCDAASFTSAVGKSEPTMLF